MITCDLAGFGPPDAAALDRLLRLHLALQRRGASLRIRNACPELRDLLTLAGLDDVLLLQ